MTIRELVKQGEQILKEFGIRDAKIDARLLILSLLECDVTQLLLSQEQIAAEHLKASFMYLIAKRTQGIPLQYITSEQSFMGLDFYVDERVLIPRQDTEILVEKTIKLINKKKQPIEGIEIGTGSGCIAISLVYYVQNLKMTSIDVSPKALEVAQKNCKTYNCNEKIKFIESDLFENVKNGKVYDFVISNPPYISIEDHATLEREVLECEPRLALTDEGDGLKFYRDISKQAKTYLKRGGFIAFEIGYNQGITVREILENEGYSHVEVIKDLARKDRVVIAYKL
ncbi:MAG: protein-(glutamine-N5) methyltransferase, release factor-specific [Epulopiscium sp. Nele67-Bin005]|nr:MAG: protein-(glutamine-N5) methyltransferase, release factor-specific [Epulopiscium sp. Nele67-Bin005]